MADNLEFTDVPSPYFTPREDYETVQNILIKRIDKKTGDLLKYYSYNENEESAHFVVGTNGIIYNCVGMESTVKTLANNFVLVVLSDGIDDEGLQLKSLQDLLVFICCLYTIPLNRIVIDPSTEIPIFDFLNSLGSAILESLIFASNQEDEN